MSLYVKIFLYNIERIKFGISVSNPILTSLTMPEMDSVSDEVCETRRNSEASIRKARTPP